MVPGLLHFFRLQKLKRTVNPECVSQSIRRLELMTISWVLLGVGSFIFHATQTGWGELIDELGMISVSTSTCYSLRGTHFLTTGRFGVYFYSSFFGIVCICMTIYFLSGSHTFFSIVFICSSVVSVALLNTSPSKGSIKQSRKLRAGVIFAIVGYGIWHVDQACVHAKWSPSYESYEWELQYWSHPLWHILTAFAADSFISTLVHSLLGIDISSIQIYRFDKLITMIPTVGFPVNGETYKS